MSLTIIANALRVGDHLLERLGVGAATAYIQRSVRSARPSMDSLI